MQGIKIGIVLFGLLVSCVLLMGVTFLDLRKRTDYAQAILVQENLRLQKENEDLKYEIWSLEKDLWKQQKGKKSAF